jgi:hypothetical protein
MKQLTLLAALLFAVFAANAKKFPGYVVFPNNDTLHGTLKIGTGLIGHSYDINAEKITFIDSSGKDTVYHPGEILAFGFTDNSQDHIIRSKPHRDSTMHFHIAMVIGARASLYWYVPNQGGGYGSPLVYYRFERGDGAVLFLKNYDKLETLQNKLKEFYGDSGGLGAFIDGRFTSRWKITDDIQAVVVEANKRG